MFGVERVAEVPERLGLGTVNVEIKVTFRMRAAEAGATPNFVAAVALESML